MRTRSATYPPLDAPTRRRLWALGAVLTLSLAACGSEPNDRTAANTAVNARDRDGKTVTPMDQSESASDRDVTQKIRQALVADDSLSTDAKNVKIVTNGGAVTLRGPVDSAAERATIESKARAVSGATTVQNQLEVARR